MSIVSKIIIGCATLGMITGCTIIEVPVSGDDDENSIWVDEYEVDAYVSIPYPVRTLIYDAVDGYSMPPVDRYGYEIYPVESDDPDNIPSYVSADFNGDGYDDYAYMFSALTRSSGKWHLDTKMIVVTSTRNGYELSLELELGTVSGSNDLPVEEYWGIRLLRPGTHTVTDYYNGVAHEKKVKLPNAGIYLASIDPEERSTFVANQNEISEIVVDFGAIAKKRVPSVEKKDVTITTSTIKHKI
ncbi:MAG TPA: hypothetical protein VHO70_02445 [Chitinispirillaceae bacterium]|nr:hypothetical protein [Chitinispirillaceae bacterium]